MHLERNRFIIQNGRRRTNETKKSYELNSNGSPLDVKILITLIMPSKYCISLLAIHVHSNNFYLNSIMNKYAAEKGKDMNGSLKPLSDPGWLSVAEDAVLKRRQSLVN